MAKTKTPATRRSGTRRTSTRSSATTVEFLLEIGTEELPYQFIQPVLHALRQAAERLFRDHRLSHGDVHALGTPRRLVLLVDALAAHQTPTVTEVLGPPKAVGFDTAGQPTKAAIGFAASQGLTVNDVQIRQTAKGEYLCATKQEAGRPVAVALSDALPGFLSGITFPKAMHWNESGTRFARPIRWLLALCGGRVLPIEFAGIKAANVSWGHRFVGTGGSARVRQFAVRSIRQYLQEAERHGVIVDQDRRRRMIVTQLAKLADSAGGRVVQDEDLLEQAVFTVEHPHTVLGSFDPSYSVLPKDVLITSMKEHQGYFSLVGKGGALLPHFLAVTNMKLPHMGLIREGNERVLAARLADAKFFFDDDRQTTLQARVDKLKTVTFHQQLGTMHQKAERVAKLASDLATQLGDQKLADTCARAAMLCKTDLLTGMVGEFPTLQGIMGAEYAKHDGEAPAVCQAIHEHYLPKGMEGELPATLEGKILSLADRLDTIAAFFLVGLVPTGSEDPFALRRHATAIVRLLLEGRLCLNLGHALQASRNNLVVYQDVKAARGRASAGARDMMEFLFERVRHYGRTGHTLREDVMEAVLRSADHTSLILVDLLSKMIALQEITSRPEFNPLIVGFKRAHRLTEKEQWEDKPVDPSLFQHQAETQLHHQLQTAQKDCSAALTQGEHRRALESLVALKPAIDDFFQAVMVNAPDAALRNNRLSLLKAVDSLFATFADFSQIVVQGS